MLFNYIYGGTDPHRVHASSQQFVTDENLQHNATICPIQNANFKLPIFLLQ